jgi:hypothetical protein
VFTKPQEKVKPSMKSKKQTAENQSFAAGLASGGDRSWQGRLQG